jgi:hypothetical protein
VNIRNYSLGLKKNETSFSFGFRCSSLCSSFLFGQYLKRTRKKKVSTFKIREENKKKHGRKGIVQIVD